MLSQTLKRLVLAGALAIPIACTINPVTGQRQLAIVSADDEIAIGNQQYLPSQQMQGGEYLRDPALSTYVRSIGNRLGAVSDRALPYEFVVINSSVPNAWALPGGKIAVNRGLLLELQSEAELAAVLGHEIVHAAARHGAQAMQRGILLQGAVLVAAVAARNNDYSDLAVGAAGLGAELINMRNGREAELEADAYGMRYMSRAGYDPQAAIDLQETFLRLSEGRDTGGWLAGLFASHPPSAERVTANRATAASLPAGGTLGRESYRTATENLRRDAPGYSALDDAMRALNNGDLALARQEADTALDLIPDEAQVPTLLGDIEMAATRPERAIAQYSRALELNDRFFYSHLAKAKAHLSLEQWLEAELAYQASIDLLPTADAYLGLGRIAEARGNRALALEHYARAGESSGQAGVDARAATVRLDLPANPERYLSIATSLDRNGQLLIQVGNPTPLAITGITLLIADLRGGRRQVVGRILDGTLQASSSRVLASGIGPFSSSSEYEVGIDSARVAASE